MSFLKYMFLVTVASIPLLLSGCSVFQSSKSKTRVGSPKPAIVKSAPAFPPKILIERAIDDEKSEGSATGYLMRIKQLSEPVKYLITRQDRTIETNQPQYTTNIDIEFVAEVWNDPYSRLFYSVDNFKGIDHDKSNNKHLKNISTTIEEQQWVRSFDEFGVRDELEFVNYNPGGWVGMMTARALGRYEFSFMDIQFPKGKRDVGDIWLAPCDLMRESKANFVPRDSSDDFYKSSGIREEVKPAEFRLVKVAKEGERTVGEISYHASGTVKVEFDSDYIGKDTSSDFITVKGTVWIDMETGWPIKSKIVRRHESTYSDGKIIDEQTTTSKRI